MRLSASLHFKSDFKKKKKNIREKPTVALHNDTNGNRDNLTGESDNDGPPLFDKKAKQGFKTTAYR